MAFGFFLLLRKPKRIERKGRTKTQIQTPNRGTLRVFYTIEVCGGDAPRIAR